MPSSCTAASEPPDLLSPAQSHDWAGRFLRAALRTIDFLCLTAFISVSGLLWSLIPGHPSLALALLVLNATAFLMFGADKAAAGRGGIRIPESALHLVTVAGGAAGAAFGRVGFRHKTLKPKFSAVAIVGIAVHGLMMVCLSL